MKKLLLLIATVLLTVCSVSAEKIIVFDVDMSTLQAEIQWNPDWSPINNNKGFYKDTDGDYVSFGHFRGATEKTHPLVDLTEGDTAILTVNFWMKNMARQNLDKIIFFGLAEDEMYKTKDGIGSNGAFGGMDQAKVAGFYLSQSEWTDSVTNLNGTMKFSADMGANFTVSDAQLWGLSDMNTAQENTDAGEGNETYINGDSMQCVYKVVKTSTANTLSISAVVTNAKTSTEVIAIAPFDYVNAEVYNSDSLFFVTEAKTWTNSTTMAITAIKLEKTGESVEPATKDTIQLLNTNGDFETGDGAGWAFQADGQVVEADAACTDYDATSVNGLHIKNDETAKVDGLAVIDLPLIYGETYTFEMKVKVIDYSNYGDAQLITTRIQPNAWNDNFKDIVTKSSVTWGMPVAEGIWTRVSMTKTIESYDTKHYVEGAVVGDTIASRIYFQSVRLDSLEMYIDDVRVYKGTLADEMNSVFVEPITDVVPDPTALQPIEISAVSVAPNPTTGFIQLSETVKLLEVYSTTGAFVKSMINTSTLDISELNNGVYMLRADSKVVKIVKQ